MKKKSNLYRKKSSLSGISTGAGLILNTVFILYCAVCILPLCLVVSISFSTQGSLVNDGYRLIPSEFSITAYSYVFQRAGALLHSYGITIFSAVAGTVLSLLVTALFAYPLSRKDFKYRNVLAFITFLTMIFNGGMVATYIVYVSLCGLKNNLFVYLLPFLMTGWNVMLLRTFMSSLPESLTEAARIDGAGEFRIFFQIVLPLSLPGLATIALFNFIGIWNDWNTPLLYITKSNLYNLQYLLYNMITNVSFLKSNVGLVGSDAASQIQNMPTQSVQMAMCVMAIGPIVFAYPFFQKYFIKGLTVGAVKG